MAKLKAILRTLFHVARRNSESAEMGVPRLGHAEMSDLLVEDTTPEHERGEW